MYGEIDTPRGRPPTYAEMAVFTVPATSVTCPGVRLLLGMAVKVAVKATKGA